MISKAKWDRLIKHLEKVEEVTGGKLRKTPRYNLSFCPIGNYAPGKCSFGFFEAVGWTGRVYYNLEDFIIYEPNDNNWWCGLTRQTKIQITRQVSEWIKSREVNNV